MVCIATVRTIAKKKQQPTQTSQTSQASIWGKRKPTFSLQRTTSLTVAPGSLKLKHAMLRNES